MKSRRDALILDDIAFAVKASQCFELLRLKPGSRHADEFAGLLAEARGLARPRAAFKVTTVQTHGDDCVDIDGVRFTSRIMRINFENVPVVFPFIATCGHELDTWSETLTGTLHLFWADTIRMLALGAAMSALEEHLRQRVPSSKLSTMNPGSLEDWPLQQQAELFDLLGSAPDAIGVRLKENHVMIPLKSATGIQFVTEEKFLNCRLCPRENCQGRRAPYDVTLYETKYNNPGR